MGKKKKSRLVHADLSASSSTVNMTSMLRQQTQGNHLSSVLAEGNSLESVSTLEVDTHQPRSNSAAIIVSKNIIKASSNGIAAGVLSIHHNYYTVAANLPASPIQSEAYSFWNVPDYTLNFMGREKQLSLLHQNLDKNPTVVISQTQVIAGLGGVGKTQLALKYAYDHREYYERRCWWINAEQRKNIIESLRELAKIISIPYLGVSEENLAKNIYDALASKTLSLFIFDNVDNYKEIEDFLPSRSIKNIHVVITTRNQKFESFSTMILDPYDEDLKEDAINFIKANLDEENPEQINILAEKLGYLALAVSAAVATIQNVSSIDEYIEGLDKRPKIRLHDEPFPQEMAFYKKAAFNTINISLEKIRADSPAAYHILELCSYFAPDSIPKSLLVSIQEVDPIDILNLLIKSSLIEVSKDKKTFKLHRLTQLVIRICTEDEAKARDIATNVLSILRRCLNPKEESIQAIKNNAPLITHVIFFTERYLDLCTSKDDYFDMIIICTWYFLRTDWPERGYELLIKAELLCDQILSEQERKRVLSNILHMKVDACHQSRRNIPQAIKDAERDVALKRELYGEKDQATLYALADFAYLLAITDRRKEAFDIQRFILENISYVVDEQLKALFYLNTMRFWFDKSFDFPPDMTNDDYRAIDECVRTAHLLYQKFDDDFYYKTAGYIYIAEFYLHKNNITFRNLQMSQKILAELEEIFQRHGANLKDLMIYYRQKAILAKEEKSFSQISHYLHEIDNIRKRLYDPDHPLSKLVEGFINNNKGVCDEEFIALEARYEVFSKKSHM